MTSREIEVQKTETETVYTCDECGLGDDAEGYGKLLEYNPPTEDYKIRNDHKPNLHFHERCVSEMTGRKVVENVGDKYAYRAVGQVVFIFTRLQFLMLHVALLGVMAGSLAIGADFAIGAGSFVAGAFVLVASAIVAFFIVGDTFYSEDVELYE